MANMFDENGNYNKTEWKPGDRITAGKLNKIEESLEAINNNDIERHKEADERLDALEEQKEAVEERFDELEDLVADNKSEVDTAIYEVHSKMDRLEQEMNDGIDTVEAIAHTVDDKIAEADASMKAQVAEVDTAIYEVHSKMDRLEQEMNDGIDTVEAIAHTVDDKIAEADASMKAQVAEVETIANTMDSKIAAAETDLNNIVDQAETMIEELEGMVPTKTSQLTNDSNFLTSIPSQYVTETDLNAKVNEALANGQQSNIPTYVRSEAIGVADKVIETRNAYSIVISGMSDLHTTGSDDSATGVLHAFQGINEIDKITPVDLVAIHGDVMVGYLTDEYKNGFKHVRTCMNEVTKNIPLIHMQGNHDDLSSDTTEVARQKYFRYIGANNEGTVTDFSNRFRNYGYKDFDNLRIRFIYLNSADASDYEQTGNEWITPMQFNWFINTALNFSDKEGSDDWHWIVACHHPLNSSAVTRNLLSVLQAYTSRTSGSFYLYHLGEQVTISYDFTNAKQRLICHLHGHIHNFRTEWFDDVLSITVPNACYDRNNEYGTYEGYDDSVHELLGDADENGVQRQFNKTRNSANDTAFVTFVIDSRVNNKIYAYCYGAGVDREINLITKEVKYEGENDIPDVPENPTEPIPHTNLIPTSVDEDGAIFNQIGYMTGYRISSSGSMSASDNMCITGFIDAEPNQTIRLKNIEIVGGNSPYIVWYDQNKNFEVANAFEVMFDYDAEKDVYIGETSAHDGWFRMSLVKIDDSSIITLDQEITEDNGNNDDNDDDNDKILYEYQVVDLVNGKIDRSSGAETQETGYFMTEFIQVTPGSEIDIQSIGNGTTAEGSGSYISLVEYGADKSFISCASTSTLFLGFDTAETRSAKATVGAVTNYIKLRIYLGAFASSSEGDVAYRRQLEQSLLITSQAPLSKVINEELIVMSNRTYTSYSDHASDFLDITTPHELDVNKYYPAMYDGRIGKYPNTKLTHTVDTATNGFTFRVSSSTGYGLLFPIKTEKVGSYAVKLASTNLKVLVDLVQYNANKVYVTRTRLTNTLSGNGEECVALFDITDATSHYAIYFSIPGDNTNKDCNITNLTVWAY